MNKKLLHSTIAGILFTFFFGTILHFFYEWSNENFFVGLLTPVNESTWEHIKLLFFPMLCYGVFAEWMLKDDYPCISFAYPIGILIGTFAIPIIFYTYSGILGRNYMVLDILTFYISVVFAFSIMYYIAFHCTTEKNPSLPRLMVVILFVCFLLFTYAPPALGIFSSPIPL